MPRYIAILFALPLLLSCNESAEAKLLAQKKAEAEFEAKLKTEYEKMFGEPISDFEFLTKKVDYYKIEDYIIPPKHIPIMSMTRTSTGAFARFEDYHTSKEQEIELDILEWLDFVNMLRKFDIRNMKSSGRIGDGPWRVGFLFGLEIQSFDTLKFHFERDSIWLEFEKKIDSAKAKIERDRIAKLDNNLKTEYAKRFGKPINDFELSIMNMYFSYCNESGYCDFYILATKTATGILVEYRPSDLTADLPAIVLKLDILEWLDFVNALHKCNINEWKRHYYGKPSEKENISDFKKSWNLEIHRSDYNFNFYNGQDSYPHNCDEFMKVMTDFEAKIKSKAGAK